MSRNNDYGTPAFLLLVFLFSLSSGAFLLNAGAKVQ